MSISLSIFTEASTQIGTGHLIESFNIAQLALNQGCKVNLWVSESSPMSLLTKAPCSYHVFDSLTSEDGKKIRSMLIRDGCQVILFNLRSVSNEIILSMRFDNLKTVCIDELGGRHLECDIIINPLVVSKYYNYSTNNNCIIYTGPNYLSMSPEFAELHEKEKVFNQRIENITVCMGGVDRTGVTLKIMDVLADWDDNVRKNIILGGGFLYTHEIDKRMKAYKAKNFIVYHNVSNIGYFLWESDIVFTSGGNTLYELACIGTPAIVLYEDEHEKENGRAFEARGFGYCIGRGSDVTREDILTTIEKFKDVKNRQNHSIRGKQILDGNGCQRILNIINELVN